KKHTSSEEVYASIDVSEIRDTELKSTGLINAALSRPKQKDQLSNPDARIVSAGLAKGDLLLHFADYGKGSTTGDSPHYLRLFFEWYVIPKESVAWLDSPNPGDQWSGRSWVCAVSLDNAGLRKIGRAHV